MPHGENWTREEHIVAFNLYCRTPFGKQHKGNPEIIELAKLLHRTPSSVAMKLNNFTRHDPAERARGIKGLRAGSNMEAAIWHEFNANWEQLAYESELAKERLRGQPAEVSIPIPTIPTGPTEAIRQTRVRLVQSFFRETVLLSYDSKCAVCQISERRLLTASHIIPWQANEKRRADPSNGLALCALHDRAFDQGLIGFDTTLCLLVSPRLKTKDAVPLHRAAFLELEGKSMSLPIRFQPDRAALGHHRMTIYH